MLRGPWSWWKARFEQFRVEEMWWIARLALDWKLKRFEFATLTQASLSTSGKVGVLLGSIGTTGSRFGCDGISVWVILTGQPEVCKAGNASRDHLVFGWYYRT